MTAAEYAAAIVKTGEPLSWAALERAAFAEHPDVLKALDPPPRSQAERGDAHPVHRIGVWGLVLTGALAGIAAVVPIAAAIVIALPQSFGWDPVVCVTIAAVAAILYIAAVTAELIRDRKQLPSGRLTAQLFTNAGFSTVAAFIAYDITGGAPTVQTAWAVATIGAMAVASIAGALHTIVRRNHIAAGADVEVLPSEETALLALRLPDAERARIIKDIDEAVDLLEKERVIQTEVAESVKQADLGTITAELGWQSPARG
ncbi:hypothetical protein [Agromyces humi]|uniref:hypothetical protein n=1 Tax=Agromyces humi TaxID=1766800 RepID=UPI001359DF63|nr:hypothetical protein [Agromyces humi]